MNSTLPITPPHTITPSRRFSSQGLAQAYGIRKLVYDAIDALSNELRDNDGNIALVRDGKGQLSDAQALVQLTRAWSEADDRIRIHRGKPLPGSLRPAPRKERIARKDKPKLEPLGYLSDLQPASPKPVAPAAEPNVSPKEPNANLDEPNVGGIVGP